MTQPIVLKKGSTFLDEDELLPGEAVWDHAEKYAKLGVGAGERGPRWYPGVDRYGNLRMSYGTNIRVPMPGYPDSVFGIEGPNFVVRLQGKVILSVSTLGIQVAGLVSQTNTGSGFLPSDSGLAELLFPLFTDKTMLLQLNRPAFAGIDAAGKFRVERTPGTFLFDFNSTMTRAQSGVARYATVNGVYINAQPNEMRLAYSPMTTKCRGLLIEPASANLVLNSAQLSAWPTNSNLTLTQQTPYNWLSKGLNPPYTFSEGTANAEHSVSQAISANPTLPTTISFYYQSQTFTGTRRLTAFVGDPSRANLFGVNFDAVSGGGLTPSTNRFVGNGQITATDVENVGGGIYRVTISGLINPSGTNAAATMNVTLASLGDTANNTNLTFQPGANTGNWCLIGDVQVEALGFVTSYIQTGANVLNSRGSDTLSLNLSNFRFSPVEGTFEIRFKARSQVAIGAVVASLQNADGTTRLDYYIAGIDTPNGNYNIGVKTYVGGALTNTQVTFTSVSIAKSSLVIAYANLAFTPTQLVLTGQNGFIGHYTLISYE